MTEPYIRRSAGDFITAKDWNDLQIKLRELINSHTHSGEEDQGTKLLQDAISQTATLLIKSLTVREISAAKGDSLNIKDGDINVGTPKAKSDLTVNGNFKLGTGSEVNVISNDGKLKNGNDTSLCTENAIKSYVDERLPKGAIIMWSGEKAPPGWALCDGKKGTPDLRNRFILGSGKQRIHSKGGEESHRLTTAEMPSHNHRGGTGNKDLTHSHKITTYQDDYNCSSRKKKNNYPSFGADNGRRGAYHSTNNTGLNHNHVIYPAGGNAAHNNMPPFYVLAYIIKL